MADLLDPIGGSGWFLLLASPFIGSFLGVLIRRLPEDKPIVGSRSACEWCGARLAVRDLVPLLSWLVRRGRCRFCGHPLGWFYPGVELAAMAVAVIAVAIDRGPAVWLDCLLGWWLLALGWIDLRRWTLPDPLNLPLIVVGLTVAAVLAPAELTDRAAGAIFGYLALRAVAWVYLHLRGREGLGHGDAKLLAASGAWLGATGLPSVILLAAAAALASAAVARLFGARMHAQSALPFGPFLALATWLVWLFGPLSP